MTPVLCLLSFHVVACGEQEAGAGLTVTHSTS